MTGKVQGSNRHNKRARYEDIDVSNGQRISKPEDRAKSSSGDDVEAAQTSPVMPASPYDQLTQFDQLTQLAQLLSPQATTIDDTTDLERVPLSSLPEQVPSMPWLNQETPHDDFFGIDESLLEPCHEDRPGSQQSSRHQDDWEPPRQDAVQSHVRRTTRQDDWELGSRSPSRRLGGSTTPETQSNLREAPITWRRLPLNGVHLLEQLFRREEHPHLRPDLTMARNKSFICGLTKVLADIDQWERSGSDLMLCTLFMHAVVNSYRQLYNSWSQTGFGRATPGGGGGGGSREAVAHLQIPGIGFGFGTFEIDAKSQRGLFKQVFIGEIDKTMMLWTKIWAAVVSQQLNGQEGKGICENILLAAGGTLKRMRTEMSRTERD
ncbi:hypothetical protein CGGC5_v007969 [Colletotrichum fructicola Nara gc5]|uniref:Uncharacterized protein n=1 Tax=Colletotrichum fructicola (strain Nara gc5) TaxID=1213859 RepID=A0A7J6J219_COLFN|nr:hypothetical protein CFRS1_v003555 [Colletotrichum fructicola]KAF4483850.1 hypothetical protein CGGC5_v007969 [Colletotrichum fructicola Nara gc5]KAF5498672.1 hypothetical protein CGCF413_v007235 [Colletotrichum fructicola]